MAAETAESSDPALHQGTSSPGRHRSRSASEVADRKRSVSPLEEGEMLSSGNVEAVDNPPLPDEAPPGDDGWAPMWDNNAQAYYFYNRFTQISQWENPRVPEVTAASYGSYDRYANGAAASSSSGAPGTSSPPKRLAGGYNPAIHGSYDPNADYAVEAQKQEEEEAAAVATTAISDPSQQFLATAQFNRFTGRFQNASINPENHSDEAKSKRQMGAFFDVDAAANNHDGRSLKAERRNKNLSKQELKAFKEKRRERKEEKRRAWLRD